MEPREFVDGGLPLFSVRVSDKPDRGDGFFAATEITVGEEFPALDHYGVHGRFAFRRVEPWRLIRTDIGYPRGPKSLVAIVLPVQVEFAVAGLSEKLLQAGCFCVLGLAQA